MRTLLSAITLTLLMSSIALAGLDTDGKFDQTIAIYDFETTRDSGPREFHGKLQKGATITSEGKIGKGLKLPKDAYFYALSETFLGMVDNEVSIVAWVKLQKGSDITIITRTYDDEIRGGYPWIGTMMITTLQAEGIRQIAGSMSDMRNHPDIKSQDTFAKDHNIKDNQWHHIAYTKYAGNHTIFVDGKVVARSRQPRYLGFVGDNTYITIRNGSKVPSTTYVDEVAFFETGFSIYEVKGLYNSNLETFLKAMPVDPQAKKATTWGEIKKRY